MKLYEQESVDNKLFRLKEMGRFLDEARTMPKGEFVNDNKLNKINSSVMFNLLISITIILDIGQHLLTQYAQRTTREYREVIKFLAEEKIIPEEFAKENEAMVSFRNMLVHEYDKVDYNKVYDYLQKAPDVFRQFAKHFVEFMEKRETV